MKAIKRESARIRILIGLAAATAIAGVARAEVELRVEPWPNSGPIEAYVRVSDANGSVAGLAGGDFAVRLDGVPVGTSGFGLPPDQDSAQKTSVVFAFRTIDNGTQGVPAMIDFINRMAVGDYAGAIRFQARVFSDGSNSVRDLTYIDGGTGTDSVTSYIGQSRIDAFRDTLEALHLATQLFEFPSVALPPGPRAIILVDGRATQFSSGPSQSEVVAGANSIGLPIFAIQRGTSNPGSLTTVRMQALAESTGGVYFAASDEAQAAQALATVAALLDESYRLAIPPAAVTDCNRHMLEVTVRGESASLPFTRCDSTPERLDFDFQTGVARDATIVSNAVTLSGFESPVEIGVIDGEYSIGCGNSFTSAPSMALPGNQVCVRHRSSQLFATTTSTVLIAGGVQSWFSSTTQVEAVTSGGGGGGGGGGAGSGGGGSTGVIEALFLLAILLARWRPADQDRRPL